MERVDEWIKKFGDVDPETVLEWIEEAMVRDLADKQIDEYLDGKYLIFKADEGETKEKMEKEFTEKWAGKEESEDMADEEINEMFNTEEKPKEKDILLRKAGLPIALSRRIS